MSGKKKKEKGEDHLVQSSLIGLEYNKTAMLSSSYFPSWAI